MGPDEADLGEGAFLLDAAYARELADLPEPEEADASDCGGDGRRVRHRRRLEWKRYPASVRSGIDCR